MLPDMVLATQMPDAPMPGVRLFLARPLDSFSCNVILRDILLCCKILLWNWRRHCAGSIHKPAHNAVEQFRGASIA